MGVSSTIGIKSIQRGTSAMGAALNTGTVTVSAVDMKKAKLSLLGSATTAGSSMPEIRLTAATAITWKIRSATGSGQPDGTNTFSWELIEWY
jgi:hypothetical protein